MADPELSKLLRPRSVAVVGASAREGSTGLRLIRHLQMGGFAGPIYPINPRYPDILGIKCYPSLSDVSGPIDAMFVALPSEDVLAVIEEASRLGVGAAVVNAAGFADAGSEGAANEAEMVRIATQSGMALCGPNTNGIMSLLGNAYLCDSSRTKAPSAAASRSAPRADRWPTCCLATSPVSAALMSSPAATRRC